MDTKDNAPDLIVHQLNRGLQKCISFLTKIHNPLYRKINFAEIIILLNDIQSDDIFERMFIVRETILQRIHRGAI